MTDADPFYADKSHRGNASQFFVAGELCRRGWVAVVTMGNCPNTDVLVSNKSGTKFAHVQVKTFVPGNRTCSVGMKTEKDFGPNFFWILAGIPLPRTESPFVYYVIPAAEMKQGVRRNFEAWASTLGKRGQPRNKETTFRTVQLPPWKDDLGWDLSQYANRWDSIESILR